MDIYSTIVIRKKLDFETFYKNKLNFKTFFENKLDLQTFFKHQNFENKFNCFFRHLAE